MSTINNWMKVRSVTGEICLFGYIGDDPRFEDNHRIITSPIDAFAIDPGDSIAITQTGTIYQLGEPFDIDWIPEYHEAIKLLPLYDSIRSSCF